MWRSWEADWSKFQPRVFIVVSWSEPAWGGGLRVFRWRGRGSGWGWTCGGLCLRRSADTGTSWAWPTTSPSGWKPSPWSAACLRTWPSTSWTSLLISASRCESCPGCLTTSSRRWVWSHRRLKLSFCVWKIRLLDQQGAEGAAEDHHRAGGPSSADGQRRPAHPAADRQVWASLNQLTRTRVSADSTVLVFYHLLLLNRMVNDLLEEHTADWDVYLPAKVFSLCFQEHSKTRKRPFSALCCAALQPEQGPRGLDVSTSSTFEVSSGDCWWRVWRLSTVHLLQGPGEQLGH